MFVLDTNVFITAYRLHYPPDVFPVFWEKLVELAHDGNICSIDKVYEELERIKDELFEWAKNSFRPFFFSTNNEQCVGAYKRVVDWCIQSKHYRQSAKNDFLSQDNADAWLVAFAMAGNNTVVSFETPQPNRKTIIKVPDACQSNKVECITPMEMFRRLQVTFS